MLVSRRGFLGLCRDAAGALGLSALHLSNLEKALAAPNGPAVLWLQGAACTGCSVSFLNYYSPTAPKTAAEVLISTINLAYHPTVMSATGDLAATAVNEAMAKGNYILVVEGGIPTAFGGFAGVAWRSGGKQVTMQQAVISLAARASKIICVGQCAGFGGIPAAGPNPAGIRSVNAVTLKNTINIAGCPPHPNWMVWGIVNAINNTVGTLDESGRPVALYGKTVHDRCPRKGREAAHTYGLDNQCLKELGCRGPQTRALCNTMKWNNGQNWCVDANAQCIGCTSASFPDTRGFRKIAR